MPFEQENNNEDDETPKALSRLWRGMNNEEDGYADQYEDGMEQENLVRQARAILYTAPDNDPV